MQILPIAFNFRARKILKLSWSSLLAQSVNLKDLLSPTLTLFLWERWRHRKPSPSSLGKVSTVQSNTVSISSYVWCCTPLWLVNARNTFVTLSILCQHYLDRIALSSCEWPVRHPQDKNCFGERAFSVAVSREWNTLPQDITDITNREAFKRALKTYYFKLAYDC